MLVNELEQSLAQLKGAGPRVLSRLARLGLFTARDLLLYPPRSYEDRTQKRCLGEFSQGTVYCNARVISHDWFGFGRMRTLKIWIEDERGSRAALNCFNRAFMERQFPPDSAVIVYGKFSYKYGELQSSAFELSRPEDGGLKLSLKPVYPLTEGLSQAAIRKLVDRALAAWGNVDNELPEEILKKYSLLDTRDALRAVHTPTSHEDAELGRRTMAFSELFLLQLMIALRSRDRRNARAIRGRASEPGKMEEALLLRLPFQLSSGQIDALKEIKADMENDWPMARLLQGDVGSGKTLVAFIASLKAIEAGGQVAFMAPTELLARQHADNAARLLEPLGVRLAFLSGNVLDSARKPLLRALAQGEIDMVIGTHALFSQDVVYGNLNFVIVDEQHRFGVLQRLAMGKKGESPDMLMMSATPIPRSLALTVYGDLAISTIKSMPPGRKPVITYLAKEGNEERVYDFVRKRLIAGEQAYFVYPLVDYSEKLELKNAEAMFEKLGGGVFPGFKGGLIHARLSEQEKRETMAAFKKGELSFIVATSVVEVGVDVPTATCMIIEHAERFGLAALHQLRGRVGRGSLQSWCFLIWSEKLGEEGKDRLITMKETSDGFLIAEKDLQMRGPGQIHGTAQAGELELVFADPIKDAPLMEMAREEALAIIKEDPELKNHKALLRRLSIHSSLSSSSSGNPSVKLP